MADGCDNDGLPPPLPTEALLEDQIQRQFPPYASIRKRWLPTQRYHEQPGTCTAYFAMRIFDHDVDISYSTRESAKIRNHMATLGVTTMSAESKTEPGGYYSYPQTLEQFHVSDERKAVEVERDLRKLGREPVWKDWDQSFDFKR